MESEIRRPIAKGARRCAFTGYRPMKMPFGYDEECQLALDFKHRLHDTIEMLILQGYKHMISGGAQGMDIMAAEAVLDLQKEYPCGNYGSSTQPCRCTQKEIARYLGRISGPLLDRIDMQLEVTAVPVRQITESAPEEPSEAIHARVQAARKRQQARYAGEGVSSNAELSARQLEQFCPLDEACRELIGKACDKYNLSMRAVSRVRKVARTIADLAGEENIGKAHILEALRYRNLEGNYWK